jgi:crotonobetainyl-CoA:carnitine CoA-transferase CaiB-like acyl-CoA transferase
MCHANFCAAGDAGRGRSEHVGGSKVTEGGPLRGIYVVELGSSVAAPYAGWILATLGARVVKVERPDRGDDARHWGRMDNDGLSSYFQAFNRDKRSITVDLRDTRQRDWLREHCATRADVVIQNMRPGRVQAQGLGADELRRRNPRLIYCNFGAFGARGPLRERPGYDPLMQACGGLMSVTGEPGRPPIRVGTSVVDMGTGMWAVIGILTALRERDGSDRGAVVDVSLYETALAWMTHISANAQVAGEDPVPVGSGARGIAPYQAYACRDGHLVVAAGNDALFAALCRELGHPEWVDDPRFASNPDRARHLGDLNALLAPLLEAQDRAHWQQRLDAAGIPNAPVRSVLEAISDPQARSLGMLATLPGSDIRFTGLPLSFDGERPANHSRAPQLGAHDLEIKGSP